MRFSWRAFAETRNNRRPDVTRPKAIRSPVVAVLWEIWAAHRVGLLAVAGVIPVCALSARFLAAPAQHSLWAQLAFVPFGCSLLEVFLSVSFTEPSRADKVAVFPVRLFALPVRTLTLVAVPMLSGAVAVALLYVLWATLVFAPLVPDTPVLIPALLLSAGLMSHLAVMWGLPRLGLGRLLLSGGIGVVLLWGLVFPDALLPSWLANASPAMQVAVKSAAFCLVGLAAFGSALNSVARQRHQRTRDGKPALKASPATVRPARALPPFASPARAQLWLEWRRHGWLLPATVMALGLVAVGPLSLVRGLDPASSLQLAGSLLLVPLAMATLLGKAMAVPDFWSSELGLPPFIAIRPQSSGDIVFTRLRMAAISAGLSWLVLGACVLALLGIWGDSSLLREYWREFRQSHSGAMAGLILALCAVCLFLLTWRQLIISLYLGLCGRAKLFAAGVILSFGLYLVGWPWAVNWMLGQGFSYCEPMVPWHAVVGVITGLFILKLSLGCWIWSALYQRQLLPMRQVAGYWLLWSLGTSCLVALAELAIPTFDWIRHVGAMLCLLALPLVRPGLGVVALAANRHRASSARKSRPGLLLALLSGGLAKSPSSAVLASAGTTSSSRLPIGLAASALALSVAVVSVAAVVWGGVPHRVKAEASQLRWLQVGKGSPTVVLESDLTGLLESWWPMQRQLARTTRVVAYERAGRGGSSPAPSPTSAKQAMRQLHAALLEAHAPPPYVLVGDGLGASLVRIFASLYPSEVGGLVLLDPRQIETSIEALDWLRVNRPEQLAEIQEMLKVYPVEVHGYGFREFKRVEAKLDKLAPEARAKARVIPWDEVGDGTLYGMGIHVGHMAPGSLYEFAHMDSIILEDRAAWPLPRVPVTVITSLKQGGLITTIERESLDEDSAAQKLARHRAWTSRVPGAKHVITLESGRSIPADQPELMVETVRALLLRIGTPPAKAGD
jgi:pimeloyl-ACP methyl ester carboxylesterase